jgi:aspartyl-tRNA(Asn)/glutamyl-tRNA(Gln) amidotransferase subunit B
MHSANEAKAYAMELYHLMTYAGVTQGDLYHGNMRFDVNVSVALNDSNELGTRAEVKNLNSFRSVERATDYEFRRQVELLEKGEKVVQETRGWDEAKQKTTSQRSKEDAQDYRYMPDADIPPIVLTDEEIAEIQANVPRLPNEWRSMLQRLGLDYATIETLISAENEYRGEISLLGVIEDFIDDSEKAKYIANWNVNVFIPLSREESIQLSYENYAEIVSIIYELVKQNKLSSTNAKLLFRELVTSDNLTDIEKYAVDKGYIQVSDENIIIEIVDEVLGEPAFKKAVEDLRNGNDKVIGFLVGQVMKKSGGKANPALVQKIIRDRLKKG